MLSVGNRGTVQIHAGPIHRIETVGDWHNVLDPSFNLHIFEPALTEAWLVRKPTARGTVPRIVCFDTDGALALQAFGLRKGNGPEPERWRELVAALPGAGG